MSRPLQYTALSNNTISTAASPIPVAGGQGPTVITQGMPTGDLEVYEWYLRFYGTHVLTTSAAGTATVNGSEIFLRAITLSTDKHGTIVDALDGLSIYRLNQMRYGTAPFDVTVAAAQPTTAGEPFETNLVLPMAQGASNPQYVRPYDTILDLKQSRPTLIVQTGAPNTDITTGGTNSVNTVGPYNLELDARILNGPIVEPGQANAQGQALTPETPEWMPHYQLLRYSVTATGTSTRIPLPYGDRIYRRIWLSQRLSTTFAEQNNNMIVTTGLVGVEVNSFPWANRVQQGTLQAFNKLNFQAETMPTGWSCLDFDDTGRYADMLSVLDQNNGTCNLVVDLVTGANFQLYIILESLKPIPAQALRASQLAQRTA